MSQYLGSDLKFKIERNGRGVCFRCDKKATINIEWFEGDSFVVGGDDGVYSVGNAYLCDEHAAPYYKGCLNVVAEFRSK